MTIAIRSGGIGSTTGASFRRGTLSSARCTHLVTRQTTSVFFHVGNRVLFCGDLAVTGSTVMIPASHGGGLKAYLASLRLVLELRPAKLLPAHGPEIDDPTALIQHYIDHRRRREDRIVAALRNGCRTPESIVARVYEGLASDLKGAASETVLAHLIKLRDEHRARQEVNGKWAKV